jgi:DNA primase
MIPVKRFDDGALMGYLGRAIESNEGEPKYLFPKGLEKHLYLFGAAEMKAYNESHLPFKVVYLVESPFCVLKFTSMGLPAVSPFGWSVSDEQLQILQQLTRGVVYLPDRNKTEEAEGIAGKLARHLWCRAPALPEGIDDPEQLSDEALKAL